MSIFWEKILCNIVNSIFLVGIYGIEFFEEYFYGILSS